MAFSVGIFVLYVFFRYLCGILDAGLGSVAFSLLDGSIIRLLDTSIVRYLDISIIRNLDSSITR